MKFPFVGAAYQSRSSNVNAQRCVNFYPEVDETGKNVLALYGTPGLQLLATVGLGPIRGLWHVGHSLYVASGTRLYRLDAAWSATLIGTIGGSGLVSMDNNRTQLMLVDGVSGWIVNLGTDSITPAAGIPSSPQFVSFLDNFFIVNSGGTDQFYISTLADGSAWDPLDFASAEGNPDDVVSIITDHRELWLFGSRSTEVWYNSGADDFPIERLQGGFLEVGCIAAHSVAKADNTVYWLGRDRNGMGIVWSARGYQPQRVSNHSIETQIQSYDTISDAVAYTYQQGGHTFYVLTFPSANKTWAIDLANGFWHERAYLHPTTGILQRHRANCHSTFADLNIVGDYENGNIYALDQDTYTDNGDPIKSLRTCATVWDQNDLTNIGHHRLQIDVEGGVGLNSGQGSDPQMMLRWSDDGGHEWSNEHWATLGKIGKYGTRAIWRRLGGSRNRVYEASITDPVKRVIINAHLRMSAGNS
jgi:hypothetical protein